MIKRSIIAGLVLASAMDAQNPRCREVEAVSSPVTQRYRAALEFGALGNLPRARAELERLLRDEPTHSSAKLRLRALDDAAAGRTSQVAVIHLFRAALHSSAGNNLAALADVDSAIAASPSYDEALRFRGRTLVDLGEISRAVEDYTRALTLNAKNVAVLLNRGNAFVRLGNRSAALMDFDRAIALDSANADAFVNRGMAYLADDQDQAAIADFDRAIALDPGLAPAYNNKALLLEQRGQWSAALTTYETLVVRSRSEYPQLIDHARTRIDQLSRRRRPNEELKLTATPSSWVELATFGAAA